MGDLDERTPFAQYRQVGIEFTYATNCLLYDYIPTTGVDVVARNVVHSKKTPTEVVNEYRQERGLTDPTKPKMVSTPVSQQPVIDLRFFVDARVDADKRADQLRKILPPGFRVGVAHAKDLAKANVYLPKAVSAIQITNT